MKNKPILMLLFVFCAALFLSCGALPVQKDAGTAVPPAYKAFAANFTDKIVSVEIFLVEKDRYELPVYNFELASGGKHPSVAEGSAFRFALPLGEYKIKTTFYNLAGTKTGESAGELSLTRESVEKQNLIPEGTSRNQGHIIYLEILDAIDA